MSRLRCEQQGQHGGSVESINIGGAPTNFCARHAAELPDYSYLRGLPTRFAREVSGYQTVAALNQESQHRQRQVRGEMPERRSQHTNWTKRDY